MICYFILHMALRFGDESMKPTSSDPHQLVLELNAWRDPAHPSGFALGRVHVDSGLISDKPDSLIEKHRASGF